MDQERVLEKLLLMRQELENIFPDPSPDELEHLAHLAACLADEAGLLPPHSYRTYRRK
ncbi:MAG: hypothetical protein KKC30_11120 [Proteobacteria bacterium]|nr:hypothetical protein [Pseudomonadota bacterium]MBU4383393.1 hypothetical protein [Pseudomonadota bacterium]MCG2763339.1 hypothetical protein [Desulfarculaceae bacterium]